MPEALKVLTGDPALKIDGFLLPGHVSAIIGVKPYGFLAKRGKRCVITGFEPLDILQAVMMLLEQKRPKVEIQYTRVIKRGGNPLARRDIDKVFHPADSIWRGIGLIKNSGLVIRKRYASFDAEEKLKPEIRKPKTNSSCICGEVIKGLKKPTECRLFADACDPEHPVGACMVSTEGACAAYYKYSDAARPGLRK